MLRASPCRRRTLCSAIVLGLLALVVSGCLRGDPLGWKVRAKDSPGLASWRTKVDGGLGADNRRRLDLALQEIRLNIAGNRELNRWSDDTGAQGKEAIDDAVCRRVDGRELREVLQLGFEFRVLRLQQELAALENAVQQNAQLVTRTGDVDSRHYLEGLRQRQTARLERYRADFTAAKTDLAPLLEASGRRIVETAVQDPDRLPIRVPAPKR